MAALSWTTTWSQLRKILDQKYGIDAQARKTMHTLSTGLTMRRFIFQVVLRCRSDITFHMPDCACFPAAHVCAAIHCDLLSLNYFSFGLPAARCCALLRYLSCVLRAASVSLARVCVCAQDPSGAAGPGAIILGGHPG